MADFLKTIQYKKYNKLRGQGIQYIVRWCHELTEGLRTFFNECKNFVLEFGNDMVVAGEFILDLHLDVIAPLLEEVSNQERDNQYKFTNLKVN